MSYSNLVLADRPLGYWGGPSINRNNLLSNNQYSLETSTTGWTALDNSSISRVTADSWVGSASLQITPASTSEAGFKIAPGSRIQLSYGRTYTMVARVKNTSGSRSARIRIEYFTTQNGSILSEPVRLGQEFSISSSEWTTIYHTEILPVGVSTNYFMSWGVITNAGLSTDRILVDGIQFFDGPLYSMYDEQYSNDATLRYYNYQKCKPIIFNGDESVRLNKDAIIEIPNTYKLFINGAEDKTGSIDFWFTLEKPPAYRHQLLKIGPFISCYIENDKVYIDYLGNRSFVQINDWSRQHYVNIVYSSRILFMYINENLSTSLDLGSEFQFNKMLEFITPTITIGPSSDSINIVPNPSFEEGSTNWTTQNSSIAIINTDSYSGSNCLQITKQSSANSGFQLVDLLPITPYSIHSLSAYIKIPTGQESSTIQLVCEEYDSYLNGTLLKTNTQNISLSNNNWNRVSLQFTPDINTLAVKIKIIQPSVGTNGQIFLADAIMLEKSELPSIWSEDIYESDPLFISSIGLYSYDIGDQKRLYRIQYALYDDDDLMAIEYGADRFNLNYSNNLSVSEFNILSEENIVNSSISNLVYGETSLSMTPLSTESVEVGSDGGAVVLNKNGIKFSTSAFLPLSQINQYLNPVSSTIRFQTVFDQSSGDGTALLIGGVYGSYGIALQKRTNKLRIVKISDPLSSPEVLCETTTITNGLINIAINLENQKFSAKIGSETFTNIAIPAISSGGAVVIGNMPEYSDSYPDYIRNFAVDNLTEFSNINWISTGKYMLRFNANLNVSQKSTFIYESPTPQSASNTILTFNTSAQNNIYVNNELINDVSHIPNFNFASPESITVEINLETDDSSSDRKTINNLYMSLYDSDGLASSLSNFILGNNISSNNPFIMNTISSNILSHDNNIGLKFDKLSSSGCKIVPENSVTYEVIELVFKINKIANRGEQYTIFDLSGGSDINLMYSNSGLTKNGTYDLYIDGELISNISNINVFSGEIYHLIAVFPTAISNTIHLGKNKIGSSPMDGSLGKINIYTNPPQNISVFAENKYLDILGKVKKNLIGATASITDTSLTQEYIRDINGEYFEMRNLPKIKIISEI